MKSLNCLFLFSNVYLNSKYDFHAGNRHLNYRNKGNHPLILTLKLSYIFLDLIGEDFLLDKLCLGDALTKGILDVKNMGLFPKAFPIIDFPTVYK